MNRRPYSGRARSSGMGLFPLTDDEIDKMYFGCF